jgi:hypothetical protein
LLSFYFLFSFNYFLKTLFGSLRALFPAEAEKACFLCALCYLATYLARRETSDEKTSHTFLSPTTSSVNIAAPSSIIYRQTNSNHTNNGSDSGFMVKDKMTGQLLQHKAQGKKQEDNKKQAVMMLKVSKNTFILFI